MCPTQLSRREISRRAFCFVLTPLLITVSPLPDPKNRTLAAIKRPGHQSGAPINSVMCKGQLGYDGWAQKQKRSMSFWMIFSLDGKEITRARDWLILRPTGLTDVSVREACIRRRLNNCKGAVVGLKSGRGELKFGIRGVQCRVCYRFIVTGQHKRQARAGLEARLFASRTAAGWYPRSRRPLRTKGTTQKQPGHRDYRGQWRSHRR